MRVLLIEDNDADADLVSEALQERENADMQLTRVVRIQEARERLAIERFDVVLLDLSLPDAQGLEGLHRLHAAAPGTPIVVLTSLVDAAIDARALQEGAQDFLQKGRLTSGELVRAIRYARERERYVSRTRLLAEVAIALAGAVDAHEMVTAFVASVTRAFADRCVMDGLKTFDWLAGGDAITVAPPGTSRLYSSLQDADPGQPSDRVRLQALDDPEVQSAIVIPFLVNNRESGALVLGRVAASPAYVPADLGLAEEISRIAVTALRRLRQPISSDRGR